MQAAFIQAAVGITGFPSPPNSCTPNPPCPPPPVHTQRGDCPAPRTLTVTAYLKEVMLDRLIGLGYVPGAIVKAEKGLTLAEEPPTGNTVAPALACTPALPRRVMVRVRPVARDSQTVQAPEAQASAARCTAAVASVAGVPNQLG